MRRVRRSKDKERLFDALVDKETKFWFRQRADVFTLAACVGYYYGKQEQFEQTSEAIMWDFFSSDSKNVLKMIAFVDTQDPNMLLENTEDKGDKMLKIVESYANAGLRIIEKSIVDAETKGFNRLDAFFELIMDPYVTSEGDSAEEILKKIIK